MTLRGRVDSIVTSGRSATAAGPTGTRLLALAGVALLLGATLQVMYFFINVVGVPYDFLAVVAITILAATITARFIPPWFALGIGFVLLTGGLGWYLTGITGDPTPVALLSDAISLFAGQTLLRISNVHEWVLGVAPGPIFVTWYFAIRRWYAPAVVVAGGTLGFFVLTGDATLITTVTGVVGGTAAIGFGDLERRGTSVVRGETVVTVLAIMIVVPGIVSVVPAGAGASLPIAGDFLAGDDDGTLESSLIDVEERVDVQGTISLSPEIRFTVNSSEEEYWRVASYDRYTGEGWVRTGSTDPYDEDELEGPPGESVSVTQTVRVEDSIRTAPAAWRPRSVEGLENLTVSDADSLVPSDPLREGDTYTVDSEVPSPTPDQLQSAGTDYPERIDRTYTQLPASTPDRVHERTSRLLANAETPYETARTAESWLENNREYSLDVREPRGDIADAFLFEMDAGYCTYYATTMVTMLRSEGIPARFVTGYSSGERVAEDRWVVRGENSHAWVEVYFPDHGWVEFDPTPADSRTAAEQERLDTAREANETNVDNSETTPEGEWTPEPTPTPEPLTPTEQDNTTANNTVAPPGSPSTPQGGILSQDQLGGPTPAPENDTAAGTDDDGAGGFAPPTRHQIGLGLLAAVGLVAGLRRTNAVGRVYRAAWVRYQPRRGDPTADIERAFDRLSYHVQRNTHRKRKPGETVRDYFRSIDADDRVRRVAAIRERARYGGRATAADADEAVSLVDDLVR